MAAGDAAWVPAASKDSTPLLVCCSCGGRLLRAAAYDLPAGAGRVWELRKLAPRLREVGPPSKSATLSLSAMYPVALTAKQTQQVGLQVGLCKAVPLRHRQAWGRRAC